MVWDRRLYAMDNIVNIAVWVMRLYPRLQKTKSAEEVRQVAESFQKLSMPESLEVVAKKFGFETTVAEVPVAVGGHNSSSPKSTPTINIFVMQPTAKKDEALPLIIWFHGGGMCVGSAEDSSIQQLGMLEYFQNKAVIASVDYRLAPQHKFPTACNDCLSACMFLREKASEFGVDPANIAVAGMSAGAALAATVHQAARNNGFGLTAASLIVPMLRRNCDTESWRENSNQFGLPKDGARWFWENYTSGEKDAEDPRCEPMRGVADGNLAPCMVVTGEYCGFRDEGVEYIEAMQRAGVDAQHVRVRTTHVGLHFDKERWALVWPWLATQLAC